MNACIFDLDGTLTNTINAIAHFGNLALETFGFEPVSVEDYKKFVGDGRTLLIHRMLRDNDTPENFEKVCRVYDENYEKDFLYDTDAYDGIRELIAELKARNIKIAVCSNKPDNVAKFVVNSIFGDDTFDQVRGVIDGEPVKPDPAPALDIVKKLGVLQSECIFIGDTNVDIRTAKNAKITSIGVTWGFRGRYELLQAGADYIIDYPAEVLNILEKI